MCSVIDRLSLVGMVLAMQATAVKPPAGAPLGAGARGGRDVLGDRPVVVGGDGVGHAGHGGEAAGRRRHGAGAHRLLVLLTGLAQVDVDVDQPRGDDEAGGVERLDSFGLLDLAVDAGAGAGPGPRSVGAVGAGETRRAVASTVSMPSGFSILPSMRATAPSSISRS